MPGATRIILYETRVPLYVCYGELFPTFSSMAHRLMYQTHLQLPCQFPFLVASSYQYYFISLIYMLSWSKFQQYKTPNCI